MKFTVRDSQWAVEGTVFPGGRTDDFDLAGQPELAPGFAAAEATGAVVIDEASDAERELLAGHVQSQEDGEAAYAAAQASGDWHEGNIAQFKLDVLNGNRTVSIPESVEITSGDVGSIAEIAE